MQTSDRGIELIKKLEGCVLETYECTAGVLTIGYGHTGKDVIKGMVITQEKAEALLKEDLKKFEEAVEKCVKVEINQNQFDALVSFAYNVGSGSLSKSTLLKKLNAGDYEGAAEQFLLWNKATVNGVKKELEGLTERREKERELFLNHSILEATNDVPEGAATVTTNPQGSGTNYMVKVMCSALRIRKEPNTNSKIAGVIRDEGVYTIVQENNGWGKLKSGAGWICLKYTAKV